MSQESQNLREYEFTLITSGQLTDSQRDQLHSQYENMVVDGGGSVLKKDQWGLMKLAHPIKKQFRGHYVCYQFASLPGQLSHVEDKMKIDPDVLRYLNIKLSDTHNAQQWAEEQSRLAELEEQNELSENSEDIEDSLNIMTEESSIELSDATGDTDNKRPSSLKSEPSVDPLDETSLSLESKSTESEVEDSSDTSQSVEGDSTT